MQDKELQAILVFIGTITYISSLVCYIDAIFDTMKMASFQTQGKNRVDLFKTPIQFTDFEKKLSF